MIRELAALSDGLTSSELARVHWTWRSRRPVSRSARMERVESVQTRTRTGATGLIEECMLLANKTVAQRFIDAELPSAFRVHEDRMRKNPFVFRSAGIYLEEDSDYTGADIQRD